ncbi:MAG: MFS transporter [Alistipes sp.]
MKINTGKGDLSLALLLAIWSISAIASLPGLAISPILGDLTKIFPAATDLEIQMLTSLPSLLIIPFVLLSGKLSVGKDKLKILTAGLSIFFLSGVACIFAPSMFWLIVVSCVLGIGAGMVIPLSTGLVVDYFTGDARVRQLGFSSSINNLTLVMATVLTGYLANVDWHLPFLVYTLPGISLALSFFLRGHPAAPEPQESAQLRNTAIDRRKLAELMMLYVFITYAVLVITFYAAFLIDDYKFDSSFSGVLISLFFLAIMLPGLFINRIIKVLRQNTNLVSLVMMGVGLLGCGLFKEKAVMIVGSLLAGAGYGIMQPIIYDKAATIAPPRLATLALSFVMSMNYLAVMICPFVIHLFRDVFQTHSERFPFVFNAVLVLLAIVVTARHRDNFTLGLDASYYETRLKG